MSRAFLSSTHIGELFDRDVELLLQLGHGPDGFRKLLHVAPVEHAAVQRVVVHVFAHPADFLGDRKKREVKFRKVRDPQRRRRGVQEVSRFFRQTVRSSGVMTHRHQN